MTAGSSISHYRILETLGEGGMGVVYKAEDTALERPVALKFLANHLLNDAEAKERFLREAKAAAALHHPNVCPVYEIAEADGKTFLAMAFLKGETLEDRIAKGPLPLKDALDIARQVAEGLEAAHAKGIVHRDIKPANILISPEGRATIMDFGLARLTEASKLTRADQTMGTVAYMSPEQAQGLEVDSRTDIWALGCVLYEMVSGLRPFKGQYDQALLYEIVHEEVAPLTSVRAGVPMELELLTAKCLEKERDDRYGSAQEVARDSRKLGEKLRSGRSDVLRASQMTGAPSQTLYPATTLPPDGVITTRSRQRLPYAIAAAFAVAFLALAAVYFSQAPRSDAEQPVRRFSFVPPPNFRGDVAVSPNGRHTAFTTGGTDGGLWVQDLDQDEPRRLAGTEGAMQPFWSPNSEYLGYGTGLELRKIAVQGGASGLVCTLPGSIFAQGTWSPDGELIVFGIVFGANAGSEQRSLFAVPAQGGSAEEILAPHDVGSTAPWALRPAFVLGANARVLLFTIGGGTAYTLYAKNLHTGQTADLGPGDGSIYSATTGHLIYEAGSDLWARPFSPETLALTGPGFPLRQNARQASLADDGTLVYLDAVSVSRDRTLVWRDRSGAILETVGQRQPGILHPSLSPDGHRVAVSARESGTAADAEVWVHDLARSTKTRLTLEPGNQRTPAWSPSGDQIVYWQVTANGSSLMRKAADGSGDAVALVEAKDMLANPDWSSDGRYLVYDQISLGRASDLRYVEIGADGSAAEPVTFLITPAGVGGPKLSPDGRFVAYVSDESGRMEVYVRPFPDGAGRWQASVEGGSQPRWSRDGRELFFVRDTTLMSVSVSTGHGVTLSRPQELFRADELRFAFASPQYDVSADGRHFLTIAPVEEEAAPAPPKIRVVLNWYEEFRDRRQD